MARVLTRLITNVARRQLQLPAAPVARYCQCKCGKKLKKARDKLPMDIMGKCRTVCFDVFFVYELRN